MLPAKLAPSRDAAVPWRWSLAPAGLLCAAGITSGARTWQLQAVADRKSIISELILEHFQLAELSYLQRQENRVHGGL